MTRCPSSAELGRWLADGLVCAQAADIEAHVETCAACQQALDQLTRSPDACAGAGPASRGQSGGDFLRRLEQHPPGPGGAAVFGPHSPTPPPPFGTTRDHRSAPTVPPGRAEPPPRIVGPRPQLAGEVQALLHQRLRLIILIFIVGWALIWTHKFFRLQMTPDTVWLIMLPAGVLLAFCIAMAAIIWAPKSRSLRQLRAIELVGYAGPMVFLLWENYFTVFRPGDMMGGWIHRYVQRDLSEMASLARHATVPWCMLVFAYGVFVPNTVRRCAAMTGLLVCMILGLNLASGLWDQTIPRRYLFSYLAELATWLGMMMAFTVYGCHKISVLRQQAVEARRLGQYQIKHRLGAGGMGKVYLAEHALLRRPCAVKLIRPERAGDPRNLARFEREVQALVTLSHPNVVEVFDYGHTEDGTFYYVMEYLPGLNLEQLVRQYGPLPPGRVVHLLGQVCGALQEAHAAGLIHRDIKPSNILVCRRGGRHDVAKLLDFGLVQARGLNQEGQQLTQEGAIAGTPTYMSPEQGAGKDLDARSDLYSLGAVAYFLLTGRPPFVRDSAVQTLAAHLAEPVVAPDRHRPGVPADLQAVVLRCLEKDPARRFADADELAQTLARCGCADQWTREQAAAQWAEHSAGDPEAAHVTAELRP